MSAPPFDLVCSICAGMHEPAECEIARRWVAQCRSTTATPATMPHLVRIVAHDSIELARERRRRSTNSTLRLVS